MCKTSKLAQVEAQPEEQEFLGTLEILSLQLQKPMGGNLGTLEDAQCPVTKNPWEVTITLNEVPV